MFATEGVDQTIEFVDTDFDPPADSANTLCRTYSGDSLTHLLINGLTDSCAERFDQQHWHELPHSAGVAAARLEAAFAEIAASHRPQP